ncbi:unnamed protein product [Kuraishia capsulata CBS 1993]|uniref:Asp/Glu/hydantoin racemase n=1 Tax=Kuraishia capsulata CBS 1993 TaxID=1382522 RepID=W6MU00_9ASCO|nr:uncharacterized protein KUCA_T00004767001 [Kuraishia capsulata CBS 1993]CDK28782.1 unnamed protein product [Kuraishia capsulata CBS 1993]
MKILVINPTSSPSLEDNLRVCLQDRTRLPVGFYTCSNSKCPKEIYNVSQEVESAYLCFEELKNMHQDYDGFLVCCFSDHPLVYMLRELVGKQKPVTGIFQASILHCLALDVGNFAIVTTTNSWKPLLDKAVDNYLGTGSAVKFKGTFGTGLGVLEVHAFGTAILDKCKEVVEKTNVEVICLGCAGMVGLAKEVEEKLEREVIIVDGVLSGVAFVESLIIARQS